MHLARTDLQEPGASTERVNVRARIHHASLYKKPKLRLTASGSPAQLELGDRRIERSVQRTLSKLLEFETMLEPMQVKAVT